MIKRVLIALDGSPASHAALTEAVRWAQRTGAELRGVFIEDEHRFMYVPAVSHIEGGVAVPVPLPEDEYRQMEERVRAEGEDIRKRFEAAAGESAVAHAFAARRGDVNSLLVEEARAADLVVMGRRGTWVGRGARSAGPTTETLIHESLRPVLVVAPDSRSEGPVLFAYDDSPGVQRVVVPGAYMASLLHRECIALSVGDDPEATAAQQQTLVRYLEAYGIRPETLVRTGGRASARIVEQAESAEAGLIVMGAFGHNPLRELIFGSTTLNVLEQAPCPVLMMA